MYPNDAKTFFLNANANGLSGTLLPAVNYQRTILNAGVSCNTGNLNSILIGSQQIVYIKNNSNVYKVISTPLPANVALTYTKTNTADCFFTIVYTDYDLSTFGTGAPAYFSGDGLFSSFLLLILVMFGVIYFVWNGIRSVSVHKTLSINHYKEGRENVDL